jgi:hypothetical protein
MTPFHPSVDLASPTGGRDRPVPVPLSLDDLMTLDPADVARENEDLALWGRSVYEWSGFQVQVKRAAEPMHSALWLQMQVAGQGVVVGLSAALAAALVQVDQLALDDISPGVLSLWVHRRLSMRWPAHLPLVSAALRREDLPGEARHWPLQSAWHAQTVGAAQPTGLGLSIWSQDPCPSEWLLRSLSPWSIAPQPAPLRSLSMRWPLVAARWAVDAEVLTDLAVGDVLLLN